MRAELCGRFPMFRHALLMGFCLLPLPAGAEDSFAAVMARMKPQGPISIRYEETRFLELLDKPWRGSGYLYALPPDAMLKEQWQPSREAMAADGKRLYYLDRAANVRHSAEMRADDPLAAHIEAFRALMNGNREAIDKFYNVEFLSRPKRWELILTAKNPDVAATLAKIVVSGLPGKPADIMAIHQTDGERTELKLRPEPPDPQLPLKVEMLFKDLRGDY